MTQHLSILYTTIASLSVAEKLAAETVEANHATCVNIIPGCMSIYRLNGKIMKGTECYMIFKTTSDKVDSLKSWLKEKHPYDTPAILDWSAATSPEYFNYISQKQ